jgi:polyisoprenyl-phosphate glycosyltransferase
MSSTSKKVAAIIPAYNEENNIKPILDVFLHSPEIHEVIVIDDGSQDNTAKIAREAGARVIMQRNTGKGGAMMTGAKNTDADILFFSDADLLDFTAEHIYDILFPVLQGKATMTVGLRRRWKFWNWLMPKISPVLGGQRAILKDIFLALEPLATKDFGIETIMNAYCVKKKLPVRYVEIPGVKQVIKEKKWGLFNGFSARLKMVGQILKAEYKVLFGELNNK